MVALTKELGYSKKDIQNMVRWIDTRQKNILQLASQRKLVEASVVEDPGNQEGKPKPDPGVSPTRTRRMFR